jgi:hypothetical protein
MAAVKLQHLVTPPGKRSNSGPGARVCLASSVSHAGVAQGRHYCFTVYFNRSHHHKSRRRGVGDCHFGNYLRMTEGYVRMQYARIWFRPNENRHSAASVPNGSYSPRWSPG